MPSWLPNFAALPASHCPPAQSYIQSRGRARMQNSELLLLVQEGGQEECEVRRAVGAAPRQGRPVGRRLTRRAAHSLPMPARALPRMPSCALQMVEHMMDYEHQCAGRIVVGTEGRQGSEAQGRQSW